MAKKDEFYIEKLSLNDTRQAAERLNAMSAEGFEPMMLVPTGSTLVTIFRARKQPGRPTDKKPAE